MYKKLTKKGSASLFAVLAAPVVLFIMCLAIDFLRVQTVKNDSQRLLDDATLSAAVLARPDVGKTTNNGETIDKDLYIDEDGYIVVKNGNITTTTNMLACEITKANMEKALTELNGNIYIEYGSNDSLSTDESHPILEVTNISNESQAKNGVAYIQAKGYVPGLLSNIFKEGSVFYFPYMVESYAYCNSSQISNQH